MKSSLSLRLLLGAGIATVLALVATAIVLNFLFRLYFEDRAREELETYLLLLSGNITVNAADEVQIAPLPDPRFNQVLSGYYWQVQIDDDDPIQSPSFWATPLKLERPSTAGQIEFVDVEMGSGDAVAVAHWIVTTGEADTRQEVFLAVAIDRADLDVSASKFSTNTAIWFAILGAFLLIASWFQVRLGLKPLEKIRSEVKRVGRSSTDRLSEDYPSEVLPLANEVNQLLDTNAQTLERVRSGAGNLAHGLKTPLTVMRGVERKVRSNGEAGLADELGIEIASIEHIVERELARSRDSHQVLHKCDLTPIVERLQRVLSLQPDMEYIAWTIAIPDTLQAPFDAYDLTELLGNLLDNAMKWTQGQIHIRAGEDGENAFLVVEDDGPGIPDVVHDAALERGMRLNDDKPGVGLGLSIVQDMATAHSCEFTLGRGSLGGLEATLRWQIP